MHLLKLAIKNFRNFSDFQFAPKTSFNLIIGDNGSGKTSLLEAIHLLGLGRSFRTHLVNHIVQYQQEKFSIFGLLEGFEGKEIPVGIEKSRQGEAKIRIAGENIKSAAQLANLIPLLLITSDSFLLLDGGPKYRRQFIDWGLFHVKQSFMPIWHQYTEALKQRNLALKRQLSINEIISWDNGLIKNAEILEQMRMEYLELLIPTFIQLLQKFIKLPELSVCYQRGWPENKLFAEVLLNSLTSDLAAGYTQHGPQRSDLVIKVNKLPVKDILSRGQQKIVVSTMRLAQGILLKRLTGKTCIYLIDDLAAELDNNHTELVANLLVQLQAQVFITGTNQKQLEIFTEQNESQVLLVP